VELVELHAPAAVTRLREPAPRAVRPVRDGRVGEAALALDQTALPLEGEQLAEDDRHEQDVEREVEREATSLPRPQALLGGELARGALVRVHGPDPPASPCQDAGRTIHDLVRRQGDLEVDALVVPRRVPEHRRLAPAHQPHPRADTGHEARGEAQHEQQQQCQEQRRAVHVVGAERVQHLADGGAGTSLALTPRRDRRRDVGFLRHERRDQGLQREDAEQVQRGAHPREPAPAHHERVAEEARARATGPSSAGAADRGVLLRGGLRLDHAGGGRSGGGWRRLAHGAKVPASTGALRSR
jgi:hypothetical protein